MQIFNGKMQMSDNKDEILLARAREIVADRGGSLTEAMLAAEAELAPKSELPTSFTVMIQVKPRVAKWVIEEFGGHPSLTIEERLGAFLEIELAHTRGRVIKVRREQAQITKGGGAVTVTRDKIEEAMR